MTILTLDKKEFEKKVGKMTPELEEKITDMGTIETSSQPIWKKFYFKEIIVNV